MAALTTQGTTPATVPSGTQIAADQVGTANTPATGDRLQYVKLDVGAAGASSPVTAANPLPVSNGQTQPLTDTQLRATAVPVSGTVTASQPANTTAGPTAFTAGDIAVAAPVGDGTLVNGTSTSGSIVSLPIPAGFTAWTLLVKNYTNGTVYTEASFNSTNGTDGDWVDVKGRRTGTAPGTESVVYAMVANGYYRGNGAGFTYFRARFVGVSAFPTVTIVLTKAMGATFLNSGIPAGSSAIGSVTVGNSTNSTASGTITAIDAVVAAPANNGQLVTGASTAGSLVALACPGGEGTFTATITGGAFTTTLYFEQSNDSTNGTNGTWWGVTALQEGALSSSVATNVTTNNTSWRGVVAGARYVRLRAVGGTITTAPTVRLDVSAGAGLIMLAKALPGGTNSIGTVVPQTTLAAGAFASLSRAAGTYTFDITNNGQRGIRIWQDLTVLGASSVVTPTIQEKDPTSGKFLTLLAGAATGAGINAVGTAKLTVYPGLTAAANSVANDVAPVNIRISVTVATAASTFSIGYALIP